MGSKEEMRIFVGGISWDTTERHLEEAFSRFGKVLEAQIMLERDTGRPRGFGFVTFADQRGVEAAINEMHGRELDGRVISVNKAEPKIGSDGPGYGYSGGGGRGYSSGGRGEYVGGHDRDPPPGKSDCFKCGRPGHWARECPSSGGGGGGGKFSSRPRFSGPGGGSGGPRGDRFGGSDRYADDRYDGGRYESGGRYEGGGRYESGGRYEGGRYADRDRDRVDSRDSRYGAGRDRYPNERYASGGADRYSGDKYGGSDRYPQNGYGSARGSSDRYGGSAGGSSGAGGPARYEGGGYRERPGPYDRPSRGGRPSSYEERY